jgi:glucose-6-phosphate dehydrogenase assembly protein OpcA
MSDQGQMQGRQIIGGQRIKGDLPHQSDLRARGKLLQSTLRIALLAFGWLADRIHSRIMFP